MLVKEAAERLGQTPQQIYRLIARRKLAASRNVQGCYELSRADVEAIAFAAGFPSCPLMCPLYESGPAPQAGQSAL